MSVVLLTDSSSALPPEVRSAAGIIEVPLTVEYVGSRPMTSQPSHDEIRAALLEASRDGSRPVVAPVISSKLSGTAGALRVVAAETGVDCEVIDTLAVGGALGLAVLAASRASSPAAAAAIARESVAKSATLLVVADLRPLVAGGRLTTPSATIGTALGIVPVIDVREGRLRLAEAVRGPKRARARMIARAVQHARPASRTCAPGQRFDLFCHAPPYDQAFEADARAAFANAGIALREVYCEPLPRVLQAHTGQRYWGLGLVPVLAADIH